MAAATLRHRSPGDLAGVRAVSRWFEAEIDPSTASQQLVSLMDTHAYRDPAGE